MNSIKRNDLNGKSKKSFEEIRKASLNNDYSALTADHCGLESSSALATSAPLQCNYCKLIISE